MSSVHPLAPTPEKCLVHSECACLLNEFQNVESSFIVTSGRKKIEDGNHIMLEEGGKAGMGYTGPGVLKFAQGEAFYSFLTGSGSGRRS